MLPGHVQLVIHLPPAALPGRAALRLCVPWPVGTPGVAPTQGRDPALGLGERHGAHTGPPCEPVQIPPGGIPSLGRVEGRTRGRVLIAVPRGTSITVSCREYVTHIPRVSPAASPGQLSLTTDTGREALCNTSVRSRLPLAPQAPFPGTSARSGTRAPSPRLSLPPVSCTWGAGVGEAVAVPSARGRRRDGPQNGAGLLPADSCHLGIGPLVKAAVPKGQGRRHRVGAGHRLDPRQSSALRVNQQTEGRAAAHVRESKLAWGGERGAQPGQGSLPAGERDPRGASWQNGSPQRSSGAARRSGMCQSHTLRGGQPSRGREQRVSHCGEGP